MKTKINETTNFDDNDDSNEIVNKLIKDTHRVLFIHFNSIWLICINQEKNIFNGICYFKEIEKSAIIQIMYLMLK